MEIRGGTKSTNTDSDRNGQQRRMHQIVQLSESGSATNANVMLSFRNSSFN